MNNVQKNMFVIMGKFTDLSTLAKAFPAKDSTDLYNQTYQLGDDVGTILRVVMGFDQKDNKTKKFFWKIWLIITNMNLI